MLAEVGAIVDGKVTGLTEFGAFVDIGDGKTGMIHISEVAPVYVSKISDHLELNQEVKVKILNINDDGKISLSIKKAMEATAPPPPPQPRAPKPRPQNSRANVWQGEKSDRNSNGSLTFEDMMSKFKQVSDEKISDLKRANDSRHGGGYSRRGNK